MKCAASIEGALVAGLLAACGLLTPQLEPEPCAGGDACPEGFACNAAAGRCEAAPRPDAAGADAAAADAGQQLEAGAIDSGSCLCKLGDLCFELAAHDPSNVCVWCQSLASGSDWVPIDNAYVCDGNRRLHCSNGIGTLVAGCWTCDALTGDCCGGDGQPCCGADPQCGSFLRCQDHLCQATCGLLGEACCADNRCSEYNLQCNNNACVACGHLADPCCTDPTSGEQYCSGLTCCPGTPTWYCSDASPCP